MIGARVATTRLRGPPRASARPPPRIATGPPPLDLEPGPVLAQVVEQEPRLALERDQARSAARARGRGTGGWRPRPAGAPPRPTAVGSRLISSTAKPRSLSRRIRARIACRSSGDSSGRRSGARPTARCSAWRTRLGRLDRVLEGVRPALHRAEVGQPEADVLDEDVEVERALPVRQARVDLARLGVDEVGLDLVAVAPEQGVRERAVAPVDAGPMEVDQQRRHRVEEAVAIRPRTEREAHQQAAVLDRVGEVFGRQDGGVAGSATSARPTAVTAGRPAPSSRRRTSNSDAATSMRLLLERVRVAVEDEEPDEVARRADRQVAEAQRRRRPVGERELPGQVEQARAAARAGEASGRRLEPASVVRASCAGRRSPTRRSRATRTGGAPRDDGARRSPR